MADDKKETAEDKNKKKKHLLRRLREFLLSKSKGQTVGTQEKQIKQTASDSKLKASSSATSASKSRKGLSDASKGRKAK